MPGCSAFRCRSAQAGSRSTSSRCRAGAAWAQHNLEEARREWPDLPEDLGYTSGHEGQYCFVFPGMQLVVVRLGCTKNGGFDLPALLRGAVAAVRG